MALPANYKQVAIAAQSNAIPASRKFLYLF